LETTELFDVRKCANILIVSSHCQLLHSLQLLQIVAVLYSAQGNSLACFDPCWTNPVMLITKPDLIWIFNILFMLILKQS